MVKKLSNFTVVIRVKNEERWIGYAIQSVLDYLIKPEIVIVNNNSNDKTIDIVKFFAENPNLNNEANNYSKIKIINIANYSPGRALNLGVKNASKKYIMILSAHCILKKFNEANIIKDLEKNFYKPLIYKKAIIYNEIEELNIINKLKNQGKMAIESNEFYRDLIDLRKSSYVNFKDFKDDGFTYKPKNIAHDTKNTIIIN